MSKPYNLARTLLLTLGSSAVITIFSLLNSALSARLLGPDGRGQLAGVLLLSGLASGISQMGLATALVYFGGEDRKLATKRAILFSLLIVSVLVFLIALVSSHWVASKLAAQQRFLIAMASWVAACFAYVNTASQIRSDLKVYNFSRVGLPVATSVFLLIVVATSSSISHGDLLWAQMGCMAALSGFCLFYICRKDDQEKVRSTEGSNTFPVGFFPYAFKQHGTVLMGILLLNADKIFLIQTASYSQFAFYTLAFSISRVLSSVQDAASVAIFTRFAGKSSVALSDTVAKGFRLTFVPTLAVAVAVSTLSPWWITLLFGADFQPMIFPFTLLAFEAVFGSASWTLAQRFNAGGRPGLVLLRQGIVVMPMLMLIPLLPRENTENYLALLMLGAAALRLLITWGMIPIALKEPLPRLLPTFAEILVYLRNLRGYKVPDDLLFR